MLQKISVNQIPDNTCIKIYDPQRQKLIAVYENYKKAAYKLGCSAAAVQHACARRGRVYSQILDKEIAPRLSAIKDGDLAMITHCNKKILLNEKT
jgi:hypothetical protein